MNLVNQPDKQSLGFKLIENLENEGFTNFRFIVAYAKTSGISTLQPSMKKFRDAGGTIKGIVGIDQSNTSYEALVALLSSCDELYIYHADDFTRTFHVKAYFLESDESKWLSIGSNNFTAGGLFNNYEASLTCFANEDLCQSFNEMFGQYSDTSNNCCKRCDRALIEFLLENDYIEHEKALAKRSVAEAKRNRERNKRANIFGRDTVISTPHIPIPKREETDTTPNSTGVSVSTVDTTAERVSEGDMDYLVRHVPKAGDRCQQVHFTMDILKKYFKLKPGDELMLQQMDDIYTSHDIENRRIVLSKRNGNAKIEVRAAEVLNGHYPTDENKRPILVFKRIGPTMFKYLFLLEGSTGYDVMNHRLLSLPWKHRSLRYEIMDTDTMLSLWEDCPLI